MQFDANFKNHNVIYVAFVPIDTVGLLIALLLAVRYCLYILSLDLVNKELRNRPLLARYYLKQPIA